jgi:putative transposase
MKQEIGREKAIYRRTDHWLSAGSRSGLGNSGVVSQARLLRGQLLLWRSKFGGMNVSDAKRLKELESENVRLTRLLAEAMLENEVTKEALRKKW